MPGSMPGHVSKGYIIRKLEAGLNEPGFAKRDEFLRRLKEKVTGEFKEKLIEILGDNKLFDLRQSDVQHLDAHWFDHRTSYWPKHQPLDVLIRHGFILCIEKADEGGKRLPIEILWVCGPSSPEMTTCISPQQATLLIITPGLSISDRLPYGFKDWSALDAIYVARQTRLGPGEQKVRLEEDYIEFVQPKAEKW